MLKLGCWISYKEDEPETADTEPYQAHDGLLQDKSLPDIHVQGIQCYWAYLSSHYSI